MSEEAESELKKLVIEFLGLAKKFGDEASAGKGNPPYQAGKAVSYFRAAEKLAKIVCPDIVGSKVFKTLLERLTPLSAKFREVQKGNTDQFLIDGKPINVSPKLSDSERSRRKREVEEQLVKFGWAEDEAVLVSTKIYSDLKSVDDMVKEAIQIHIESTS